MPSRPRPHLQDSPRPTSPTSMAPSAPASLPRGPRAGPGAPGVLSAPTRPRGAYGRDPPPYARGGERDNIPSRPRGGGPHRSPSYYGPPSGPRGSGGSANSPPGTGFSPPFYDPHRPSPRRHGSFSSGPYPSRPTYRQQQLQQQQQQQQNQQPDYLSDLPAIIPGGKLRPSGLDPTIERRLAQLESDRNRLQAQVEEKQKAKRARLREWDRLVRESATGALRSEFAEAQLQKLTEPDSVVGEVAF